MKIAVIGTGFIGSILGRSLAKAGQDVVFGSRHPDEETRASGTSAKIASIGDALAGADVVILAVPGVAVAELSSAHGDALAGKVVIDATNQMGQPIANSRGALPTNIRYVRAFNTLGGENLVDPQFADGPADMFFSGPEADRSLAETVTHGVGLRPVYLGQDQEALVDALFQIWIALALKQGRGAAILIAFLDSYPRLGPRNLSPFARLVARLRGPTAGVAASHESRTLTLR
jgi:hypothetical protein